MLSMNATLLKALIALVLISVLFSRSLVLFIRRKTLFSFLQALGAGSLIVVVLTHILEALHLFAFMQWGSPHSVGHYLDLTSAILGVILFPLGFLVQMFTKQHT